jgi:hypothetical protein
MPKMECCYWQDVRDDFTQLNPELANIIDKLSPDQRFRLYRAQYPFGSAMVSNGKFKIVNKLGEFVPLSDPQVSTQVREDLAYNHGSNPVSFVLNKAVEVFITLHNRTIPYAVVPAGKIFGVWKVLNPEQSFQPAFLWNMTSGVRSTFMLPKISNSVGYNRFRRHLNLYIEPPKRLLDHWHVFRNLVQHALDPQAWRSHVLYFSAEWFRHLDDPAWREFQRYLYQMAWNGSEYWRNQFIWNLAFSIIQEKQHIKPNAFVADTIKHLFATSIGAIPGFAPAIDDTNAPVSYLQQMFRDVYQIEPYVPIIMQPHYHMLGSEQSRPVYYSLEYPTNIEFSPKSRALSSKITDLCHVRSLINKYYSEIKLNYLNVDNTPLVDVVKHVQFDFYHTKSEQYQDMQNTQHLFQEDKTFSVTQLADEVFPLSSNFVCGCVRVRQTATAA